MSNEKGEKEKGGLKNTAEITAGQAVGDGGAGRRRRTWRCAERIVERVAGVRLFERSIIVLTPNLAAARSSASSRLVISEEPPAIVPPMAR